MNRPLPAGAGPQDRLQYGQIFAEAFGIFRRHPILWVAGIISALLNGGIGGNYNFTPNIQWQFPPAGQPGEMPDFGKMIEGTWIKAVIDNPLPYVAFGLSVIALSWLIGLIFGTWAEAAVNAMVDEADSTGETTLGSGWGRARSRLGALIGTKLLLALPILLIFGLGLILLGPFYLTLFRTLALPQGEIERVFEQSGADLFAPLFLAIPLLCCLGFPIAIVTSLLQVYAPRAVLLENLGVWAGIKRSWQIVRNRFGYTLLNGAILFVISSIMGVLIGLPAVGILSRLMSDFLTNGWPASMTSDLLFLGIYIFLSGVIFGGIYKSFSSSLWTKLFKAFTTEL